MRGRGKAAGITAGGAAGSLAGFWWFATDPLAGLSVALCGAVALGWGANRLFAGR
jgi:hypothetical protein